MAFQNQPGCGCCGSGPPPCSSGTMTATVTACGATTTSMTWTVKLSGTTVASGTGGVAASGLIPGTYDLDIDKNGFNRYHTTFVINNTCTGVGLNITLTLATGFVCCSSNHKARQSSYFFTDSNGTHELTWRPGGFWAVCATSPAQATTEWAPNPTTGVCECTETSSSIPYDIWMECATGIVHLDWLSSLKCDKSASIPCASDCSPDTGLSPLSPVGSCAAVDYASAGTTAFYDLDNASVQTLTFGSPPNFATGPYTMSR